MDGLSEIEEPLLDAVVQTDEILGEGGFGTVFRGWWNGKDVAIKRLHPQRMGRDKSGKPSQAFTRFIREHQTLRPLAHPFIVQVYGWVPPSVERDSPGLVMEYLPMTLRERYQAEPYLNVAQHVVVMLSVASGLEYLHACAVIHRDLTTNNIMMTSAPSPGVVEAGYIKITDAGVARIMDDVTRDVQTMSDTPGMERYMAPETRPRDESGSGEKVRYGRAVDIYSLGVCVLAMVIKREPPSVYVLAREGRRLDLMDLSSEHQVRSLVVQCLEDDPGKRPTATQICRHLVAARQSELFASRTTNSLSTPVTAIGAAGFSAAQQLEVTDLNKESDELPRHVAQMRAERDTAAENREETSSLHERVLREHRNVVDERDRLSMERDRLLADRDRITDDRQRLLVERDTALEQLSNANQHLAILRHQLVTRTPPPEGLYDTSMPSSATCHLEAAQSSADMEESQVSRTSAPPFLSFSLPAPIDRLLMGNARQKDRTLEGCQRLFAASGTVPKISTPPKWTAHTWRCSDFKFSCGHPCILDERLHVCLRNDRGSSGMASVKISDLHQNSLRHGELPPGKWQPDAYFFPHADRLYVVVCPAVSASPNSVFFRELGGFWRLVACLPRRLYHFGIAMFDSSLVVIGGSLDQDLADLSRSRLVRTAYILDLRFSVAQWDRLPDLPYDCVLPKVVLHGRFVHVMGYSCAKSQDLRRVFSLDTRVPRILYAWSLDELPPVPYPRCAPAVLNGCLVVVGGGPSYRSGKGKTYLFVPECREYLELPACHLPMHGAICLSHDNKLILYCQDPLGESVLFAVLGL